FFSWFYLYWGFWLFGFALPDSAAKALRREILFFLCFFNLAETQRRRVFFFFFWKCLLLRKFYSANSCPSPDRSGNPFILGFKIKD
ncbi:hypothetical protein AKO67_12345, partial [Flavobacterium sp. VMW]